MAVKKLIESNYRPIRGNSSPIVAPVLVDAASHPTRFVNSRKVSGELPQGDAGDASDLRSKQWRNPSALGGAFSWQ